MQPHSLTSLPPFSGGSEFLPLKFSPSFLFYCSLPQGHVLSYFIYHISKQGQTDTLSFKAFPLQQSYALTPAGKSLPTEPGKTLSMNALAKNLQEKDSLNPLLIFLTTRTAVCFCLPLQEPHITATYLYLSKLLVAAQLAQLGYETASKGNKYSL